MHLRMSLFPGIGLHDVNVKLILVLKKSLYLIVKFHLQTNTYLLFTRLSLRNFKTIEHGRTIETKLQDTLINKVILC